MNQQKDLELLERIRSGQDHSAKEELVKKYIPMIHYIVRRQSTPPTDFDDYIQEGAIGLLKAIDEYDPKHYPIKFSTFAYICIIRRVYNVIKQCYNKKSQFTAKLLSLNSPFPEGDSRTLMDTIADNKPEPFFHVEADWVGEHLDHVLKAYLSPVEYQVVSLILAGYNLGEIQNSLALPIKVIDNARTRARLKLKKVVFQYGSLLSPNIPLKTRKRKDLSMRLEVS